MVALWNLRILFKYNKGFVYNRNIAPAPKSDFNSFIWTTLVLCKLRVFHLRLRQKKLRLREKNSGSGKKTPAPAENMWKLKFNRILTFQSGHTIFVSWYFTHAHFVQCMIDGIYSFTGGEQTSAPAKLVKTPAPALRLRCTALNYVWPFNNKNASFFSKPAVQLGKNFRGGAVYLTVYNKLLNMLEINFRNLKIDT